MTPRRDFLTFAAGAVAAGTVLPAAAGAAANPDAELIRVCAEHLVNLHTYNTCPAEDLMEDLDECPLWLAYERTRNFISASRPTTLAGLQAKARAAKAEAVKPDGTEEPDGGPQQYWSWQLMDALLAVGTT